MNQHLPILLIYLSFLMLSSFFVSGADNLTNSISGISKSVESSFPNYPFSCSYCLPPSRISSRSSRKHTLLSSSSSSAFVVPPTTTPYSYNDNNNKNTASTPYLLTSSSGATINGRQNLGSSLFASNNSAAGIVSSSSTSSSSPMYDVAIVGCGVGGHGAALQAASRGMKAVVLSGGDAGGTCVNRGCVPSKALLAASGRVREMRNKKHLLGMGITVGEVNFTREGIVAHADNLVNKVRGGLLGSLKGLGVEVKNEAAALTAEPGVLQLLDPSRQQPTGETLRAKHIIVATGSVPFVPKGIEVDEQTVFTSDGGLKLPSIPQWLAIIGSGYIGLEFADVFTALGSEVTFIEAMDKLMPTFDPEIAKIADRLLIKPRAIDSRVGVFASEVKCGRAGERPVTIKLIDAKTKQHVETLEVDACMVATGRVPNTKSLSVSSQGIQLLKGGFIPVDERMRVLNSQGAVVPNLYCIGDANGKMMLAHAASAQGIAAVEDMLGGHHIVNHHAIPAACFTHPEIAFVGLTEAQANDKARSDGFELGKSVSHFRGNSKALAEGEGDGIAKVLFRKDNGKLLGVHIIGLHASDLIQECANAIAAGTSVQQLSFMVHTHPTLSEVVDAAFKQAVGAAAH
eukprot:GHVS01097989.1.p1 GENE.GHVS01097989.1~~GHVS01097989.1.p1  ORF type:complete len:628 (-),score=101.37 GHVS01097989.1:346-2229(-)